MTTPSMHDIVTELARYTRDSGYTCTMTSCHCSVFETTDDGGLVWATRDPASIKEAMETVLNYMDEAEVDEQTAMDAWAKQVIDCL